MADTNITMVRGDTLTFGFEYDGTDQDLETAFFSCRVSGTSETLIFQKSLGNGITKVDTGKYIVRVDPTDTRYCDPGIYYYDFTVGLNGDVFTFLIGALTIEQDYTY